MLREVARRPAGLFGLLVIIALIVIVAFAPDRAVRSGDPAHPRQAPRPLVAVPLRHGRSRPRPPLAHPLRHAHRARRRCSGRRRRPRSSACSSAPSPATSAARSTTSSSWSFDTLQAFPAVILALALISLLGPSLRNVIIVIIVSFAPGYGRVSRALILSVKQNSFVEAERSLGARDVRIAVRPHRAEHPCAAAASCSRWTFRARSSSRRGCRSSASVSSRRRPRGDRSSPKGSIGCATRPGPCSWTGLALMLTTLGFTMFGETLRDVVDPRLAGVRRWGRL